MLLPQLSQIEFLLLLLRLFSVVLLFVLIILILLLSSLVCTMNMFALSDAVYFFYDVLFTKLIFLLYFVLCCFSNIMLFAVQVILRALCKKYGKVAMLSNFASSSYYSFWLLVSLLPLFAMLFVTLLIYALVCKVLDVIYLS